MPRGDRTVPLGNGPMTGRGAGFCSGFAMPGLRNAGYTYGMNREYGRRGCEGRGLRRMDYPTYYRADIPAESEREYLVRQADFLEKQLQQIIKRLNDVDKAGKHAE